MAVFSANEIRTFLNNNWKMISLFAQNLSIYGNVIHKIKNNLIQLPSFLFIYGIILEVQITWVNICLPLKAGKT